MTRLFSYLILVFFNLLFIFLLLEAGVRVWLYSTEESFETFSRQVAGTTASPGRKRKIESDSITLGNLIQKSAHPGRVYEFMPDIEATYLGKHFETNSFGMRERETDLKKPEGTFRIAGIGDSVMFGWGVDVQDSYLRVLEQTLNRASDTYLFETLNFAVPGYNTAMEVATYEERVRSFSPDLLLLHFVDNDLGIPLFMTAPSDYLSLNKSFLIEKVQELLSYFRNAPETSESFIGVEFRGQDETDKKKVLKKYQYMLGHQGFNLAMERLSRMVCEDRIPVVILAGRLRGEMKDLVMSAAGKYGFHVVEAYPVVNEYVEKNNIENTPEARKKLLWLNEHDSHPNELGHRLYAETLLSYLQKILSDHEEKYVPICD
jgi:lysophospholipase L1-like esterase